MAERNPEISSAEVEVPVGELPADMHLEKTYKIFVLPERLEFLQDVLQNMPLIVNKDKNISNQMEKVFS